MAVWGSHQAHSHESETKQHDEGVGSLEGEGTHERLPHAVDQRANADDEGDLIVA